MTIRNLECLFRPRSVAVIGDYDQRLSLGAVLMGNLLTGGFQGALMPVSSKYLAVKGVLAYRSIAELPQVPDLAVIEAEPEAVPALLRELGAAGTKAAAVLTPVAYKGTIVGAAILAEARRFGMRLLGPDSIGLMVPHIGLNASIAHLPARAGKIAFVSQSSALCTAVLDWAVPHNVGFSHFISVGDGCDVDFGDILDYLGADQHTNAILLFIEHIQDAAKFVSAARAASRTKPVLAIKSNRTESPEADAIYSAVLRRAGVLRVDTVAELFEAAETLSHSRPATGERVAILANSGALATLARDQMIDKKGRLATLSPATATRLDEMLPDLGLHANPVALPLSAPGEAFAEALTVLLEAPEVDTVLVLYCPSALSSADEVAEEVATAMRAAKRKKVVSACWMGGASVGAARDRLSSAGIPTYATPEQAVGAAMHLVQHRRNLAILMETPSSVGINFQPDVATARAAVDQALARGRTTLDDGAAMQVLAAYGIPTADTKLVADADEAVEAAQAIGWPVVLKVWCDDLLSKSDVRGVMLDLASADEVRQAARLMTSRVTAASPEIGIKGFIVQAMVRRTQAHEVMAGVVDDPTFGPVVTFGHGGTAARVLGDHAEALPPLNMNLARDLIGQTRVAKLLGGYGDRPPANLDAVAVVLCRLAQMVVDLPQLRAIAIDPLLADSAGVIALDARFTIGAAPRGRRLAVQPYPKELEEIYTTKDGRPILLRPIRPEDEPAHHQFHARLSAEDIRFRHFGLVKAIPHDQMARLTQIDYDREMAFIATDGIDTFGVARVAFDPDCLEAEFAIIIRSDQKGMGLGSALLGKVTRYCQERGAAVIYGETMRENKGMIGLSVHLGFTTRGDDEGIVHMTRVLNPERMAERRAGV